MEEEKRAQERAEGRETFHKVPNVVCCHSFETKHTAP